MRFAVYHSNYRRGLAVDLGAGFRGLFQDETGYPGDLERLIGSHADLSLAARALARGTAIDPEAVQLLPPLPNPGKIICIGLNYVDHSAEVGIALPDYPTVFARFSSSLIGHATPVAVPRQSIQFDYEGELVAVIGHGADQDFDLTAAMIGSEGLLAVITEISLRLVPQPPSARVLSLGFASIDAASRCVGAMSAQRRLTSRPCSTALDRPRAGRSRSYRRSHR